MTITTRTTAVSGTVAKGSALTTLEMDTNFNELVTTKAGLSTANTFTQPQTINVTTAEPFEARTSYNGQVFNDLVTSGVGATNYLRLITNGNNINYLSMLSSDGAAQAFNLAADPVNGVTFQSSSTFYSVNASLRHDFFVGASQAYVVQWGAGGSGNAVYFTNTASTNTALNLEYAGAPSAANIAFFSNQVTCNKVFNHASDERLKTNIVPVEDCLDKACSIAPVYYSPIENPDQKSIGVVAQQVKEVIPEAVTPFLQDDNEYLAVNYSGMLSVCLGAIKELRDQVCELKEEIKLLKTRGID